MRQNIRSSPTLWPCALLAAVAPAMAVAAQEQGVVPPAPPEVRDFQLEPGGNQTQAPALPLPPVELPRVQVVPPPAATAPPPVTGPATAPPPAASPTRTVARTAPPPRRTPPVPTSAPAPDPSVEASAPPAAAGASETAVTPPSPPPAREEAPAPTAAVAPQPDGFPWLYPLIGALAVLAGLALLAKRRPATREEDSAGVPDAVTEEAPPAPLPAVAAAAVAEAEARPRILLEFKPLMAGSTETEAAVQFELVVRNAGRSVARNVRIAIRMINAGPRQDEELAAFFRTPMAAADHRPLTIPPNGRAETRRTAVLPKDAVEAISFQGKSLFIPVVAFNIVYEWGDGRQGQTATSFVVGRETDPPTEKMAPFRLDLGPRIYRTVGQRQNELELVA